MQSEQPIPQFVKAHFTPQEAVVLTRKTSAKCKCVGRKLFKYF